MADAGVVVGLDKEDKGMGSGGALVVLRNMRAWVVAVLQLRQGR